MKNKKDLLRLKLCALALSGALGTTLTGCAEEKSANDNIAHMSLDQNNIKDLENGITQIIEVPNNDFSLVVNYKFDLLENEKWTICDDKKIITEINTKNLPKGMQVYIDNIHTDTSILATNAYFNGVLQDTMDDRIHNSLMLGFPISNEVSYVGSNQIEGQNETFIKGSSFSAGGVSKGSVTQMRRLESNYLSEGVYANKISSVIDLIIIDENNVTSCVSVDSVISVPVWPFSKFINMGKEYYEYYYEENGKIKSKQITSEEYSYFLNHDGYSRILK